MNTKISVKDLHAGYNSSNILNGISFDLEKSDFVGIIGPNGSGKTTLLRTISRVLPPKSGSVKLDSRNIYSIPSREFARMVAVVPQDTLIAFDFSVLEIVLMGRSPMLGRFSVESSKDIEIAMDALARTGTAHLKNRAINSLSGGERQRVLVARALAQEPEVILLDEPTSHLDISYQYEIMDLIKCLNTEHGLTILAVLHDLNLASQYCSRLIMMGQGEIKAIGSPESVITSENIRNVYGAEVWVRKHPTTHRPYVISGIKRNPRSKKDYPNIHIIGGGGTAAPIMARLARLGYKMTCGPLTLGDTDKEIADALGVPNIPQPQFSTISPESYNMHISMIKSSDIVILADVPAGNGNLANFKAAYEALRLGKKTVIMKPELMSERDFTDGKAAYIVKEILAAGALQANSTDEITEKIKLTP